MGFNALDQTICAILATDQFQEHASARYVREFDIQGQELFVLLYLLLQRYGEKLHHSWQDILGMLRSVADASEKELVTLGFQDGRVKEQLRALLGLYILQIMGSILEHYEDL